MRQRAFLVAMTVTLAILLVGFAVSNVRSLDLIDRQGHQLEMLSTRTGRLTGEVGALQQQVRQANLEPVVPETTSTTTPRARRSAVTPLPRGTVTSTTSTSSTTTTTPAPTPPKPSTCVVVLCVQN